MDPRYMDNLEKNTFKPCTPTMKKIVKQELFDHQSNQRLRRVLWNPWQSNGKLRNMKNRSFEVLCHKQIRNARSKRCPDRASGDTIGGRQNGSAPRVLLGNSDGVDPDSLVHSVSSGRGVLTPCTRRWSPLRSKAHSSRGGIPSADISHPEFRAPTFYIRISHSRMGEEDVSTSPDRLIRTF
uniref:Uncharacterized protein n=1 Tax=Vitis vinifera TaxID=29760 RepID=A5ACL0_VITVI|nr:hypothetical protein VITISV_040892 [Vitis vinifera]